MSCCQSAGTFLSLRCCVLRVDETVYLTKLYEDLTPGDGNAVSGEIMHELVDDVVGTWIHQPGRHDLQRVNGAAFLGQAELCE